MINVLNNALMPISKVLIKQQPIVIKNYNISNVEGSANFSLINEINTKAHIQPITPRELRKYTDTTIDSALNYKFFILGKSAYVLYSNNVMLENSLIVWNKKEFRVFGIRDWQHNAVNGWICIYASLKNYIEGDMNDKNI